MESTSNYIKRITTFLDSMPCYVFVPVTKLSTNPERFTEAVKFCIQHLNKPYEFSNDYKQIRRINNE